MDVALKGNLKVVTEIQHAMLVALAARMSASGQRGVLDALPPIGQVDVVLNINVGVFKMAAGFDLEKEMDQNLAFRRVLEVEVRPLEPQVPVVLVNLKKTSFTLDSVKG